MDRRLVDRGKRGTRWHIDWGWLYCWVVTLATIVPLRIFATWSQGVAGIGLGGLLKQRLLAGVLELAPEAVRRQGERSRVFLARALLQNPRLVVLDESFAALDPVNLQQCLECVLRRAETLLVVAHP